MRLLSSNVAGGSLPANGTIQLAFDRLLLPASITRQTFVLLVNPPPLPSYDPVTRVVSLTPSTPLIAGQNYELHILPPMSDSDPNGLRAIDGAQLDPKSSNVLLFQATPSGSLTTPPPVDFCQEVYPLFSLTCGSQGCHSTSLPAAGLGLDSAASIAATAIGRVAVGSNTGPRSVPMSPGRLFGEDMPVVDPGSGAAGNPSDSWLLYKLLLGAQATTAFAPPYYQVQWQPLSDDERSRLAAFVPGREMPYPGNPATVPPPPGLAYGDMETLSLWIAQGATVPAACP